MYNKYVDMIKKNFILVKIINLYVGRRLGSVTNLRLYIVVIYFLLFQYIKIYFLFIAYSLIGDYNLA